MKVLILKFDCDHIVIGCVVVNDDQVVEAREKLEPVCKKYDIEIEQLHGATIDETIADIEDQFGEEGEDGE